MPLSTPLLDAIEGDTPIGTDVARLDELWAKVLTGITPLDVVGSIVWDVMPADDCDIDERPDKPLVPAPVLYHIAGTATAVASCQTGAAIPEQGDEGRRLGLEQSLTSGLEALTATSTPYVPKQLNFADLVLRLVGAAADEPFMPGVILTPWLTNPALIVGFVPVEIVVGPLTRDSVFDTASNLTDTLDEFRFVMTFALPGRATNTRTGTTP